MNRIQRSLFALTGIALMSLTTACGRHREGKYQGMESAIIMSQKSGSQMAYLELKEQSAELITGTWRSATASGTFQGFLRADRIENLELQRSAASSQGSTSGGYSYGTEPCVGRYVGTLRFDNNRIVGRLEWSAGFGLYNMSAGQTAMNTSGCNAVEIDANKL